MDDLPEWINGLAAAIVSVFVFFVGAGTVGKWLASRVRSGQLVETKKALSDTFATVEQLDGFRSSLEATMAALTLKVESANAGSLLAIKNAELALQTAQRVDMESRVRWEGIAKDMAETAHALERVMGEVRGVSDQLIRVTTEIDLRRDRRIGDNG